MSEYISIGRDFRFTKIDAVSKEDALAQILNKGFLPLLILRNYLKRDRLLSNKEAANFFESLSFLYRSTGSMTKSLHFLEDRYDKNKIKFHYQNKIKDFIDKEVRRYITSKYQKRLNLTRDLIKKINTGYTLSAILKGNKFDDITIGLIESAERGTGDFVTIFKRLTNYYTTKEKYSKGLMKELAYPFVLMFVALSAFLVFLFYVIPTFAKFFKGLKVSQATLNTINLFMGIKNYFVLYGLGIVITVAVLLYLWLSNFKQIRNKSYDRMATIPIIGYFFRFSYLKWYMYEVSILITSGKTFESIIKQLLDNMKNEFFKNKFTIIYLYLSTGNTLTESLSVSDLLRPEDLDRVASAEIGGTLDETFMLISQEYEEIIELQMKVINKTLNYLALLFIAGFIIFIFIGIYLPMIQGMMSIQG